METEIQRPDGETLPVEIHSRGHRLPSQGPPRLIAVFRNTTGRRAVEKEIHLLKEAIECASSPVVLADAQAPDRPLIYVNPAFEKLSGYKQEEILGKNCRFLQGEDRGQEALGGLRKALAAGRACSVRLRNYRKDGSLFWNHLTISPLTDHEGRLTHFLGIQSDITEQVQAEQALAESEKRYKAMLTAVPDLLFVCSRQGVYLDCVIGADMQKCLPMPPQAFLGKSFAEVHPPELAELFLSTVQQVLASGQPQMIKYTMPVQKQPRWFEARVVRMDQERIFSMVRETTAEVLAEENRQARLKAEAETKARTEFMSRMSHELRTPLNAITGFARRLVDGPLALEERHHARTILSSAEHLLSMVEDILAYGRLEAGQMTLRAEEFRLPQLIDEVSSMFYLRSTQKGIGFRCQKPPQLPEWVQTDPNRLRQILINLLGNAFKFTSTGSVDLAIRVRQRKERPPVLVLAVADTGPGIPECDRAHLFKEFFIGSNQHPQSTGLGLPITKNLVELLGGRLRFRSRPGQGTLFVVRVPFSLAEGPEGSARQAPTEVPDPWGSSLRASQETALTRAEVQTLPAELRQTLQEKLAEGDMVGWRDLLTSAPDLNPRLRNGLLALSQNYSYAILEELLRHEPA